MTAPSLALRPTGAPFCPNGTLDEQHYGDVREIPEGLLTTPS